MKKKIDVLYLVEHIDREMDVATAVKTLVENDSSIKIHIGHIYLHANKLMKKYRPKVVVFPFFYKSTDLAIVDYVKKWKDSLFFNLAWEQIHYKAHLKIKAPGDTFAKKYVYHHAWGNFYQKYLLKSKVNKTHIFLNGQPAYQLYFYPYNKYFKKRAGLADEYNLKNKKRWIFIPENYRWAFINDAKISRLAQAGSSKKELEKMRSFCQKSLNKLLDYCSAFAKENKNCLLIFRPRPATMKKEIVDFAKQKQIAFPKNFKIIKDESVREWIMASDIIISSFSTSLIEAAVIKKPIFMFEPIKIPSSLYCQWYDYVSKIKSFASFCRVCTSTNNKNSSKNKLNQWLTSSLMSNGDSIQNIADYLVTLVEKVKKKDRNKDSLLLDFGEIFSILRKEKNYFNPLTHEKDVFDAHEVKKRVRKWKSILAI